MNDDYLAAKLAQVAARIGVQRPLPPVRVVSAAQMAAFSADPVRPAGPQIRPSGELWWEASCPVTDAMLTPEITHYLLATSPAARLYPHSDSDVDGHGPVSAALAWTLAARAGVALYYDRPYDLGHTNKLGDRPADRLEERWARRWAQRRHTGTATARAIIDYRRLCQVRALVAAVAPLVRLLAALAAAMAAPACWLA